MRPNTRLVWLETPTNPMLEVIDLERVAAIARAKHVLAACDNTFASPWTQRPLEHGFDLVMHSTTKYLNGHSDMVGGIVVVGENARTARAHGVPAKCRRRDSGTVRFVSGAARSEDAGVAHGAPIGFGAADRAVACASIRRSRRVHYPGLGLASAA